MFCMDPSVGLGQSKVVAWTSLLFLDEHCRMPPHQDVELVAGSYGTQRDAELAGGGLHFDP